MFELSIAFGAGLISFLSPCVLPLIPGYISFISGASLNELLAKKKKLRYLSVWLKRHQITLYMLHTWFLNQMESMKSIVKFRILKLAINFVWLSVGCDRHLVWGR